MILNIKHTANWEYIRQRKQNIINKNNERENAKRIEHTYQRGDKVLLQRGTENKQEQPFTGPHTILEVRDNGTVRLKVNAIIDSYNICRLMPYHETYHSNHGGGCNMRNSKKQRKALRRSARIRLAEEEVVSEQQASK